ncbi:MAG TPA: ATP-binding protein [Pyrinomonadaceae bacterium]|jgi:nitrogen fixation/metabolism regulation signal transduction histidine kinase
MICAKLAVVERQTSPLKRRSPPWILGGLVAFLLTCLVLLQTSNLWKELSVETANDTLALYALSSLNFIAFVIFAFIFVRSLVKLRRERRALAVGSKIKTRLLTYFFAVSLLPIIAMAVFSYLFMNRALERWFTQIPENVIREAREVQTQAIEDQTLKLTETTRMLATVLDGQEITNESLSKIVEQGNLTRLAVLSKNGEILASSERALSPEQKAELDRTILFVRQNQLNEPVLRDGKGFDVAVSDFSDGRRLVVVPDLRPEENVSQMVENSLIEFDKLKEQQITVRRIGLSTLGLLTFLLIFASSWTAFYIARGLTIPIKALAEGADEIAHGNFSHRVDVLAEDELALLVSSFNQMSSRLEANSAELLERRKYIETVLQSLSTGVISFDARDRITTINQAAIQILRLENASFENFALSTIVNAENRAVLEKLLARAKRIGQAAEQTVLARENANGSNSGASESVPVALTATALPDKNGVVLVIEDLSELLQAQRASAWAEVARRMAHEIKNPLTPIQLSAERIIKNFYRNSSFVLRPSSLENETKDSPANGEGQRTKDEGQFEKVVQESTSTILREVNSLKSMVDEFSRFARLPNVKLEDGSVNEIIQQAVALYEDRFDDVKIEANLAENLPSAMLDEEHLKRVFVNLIDNSIEAFDKSQADKRINIKSFHDKARGLIVAEISDNGTGIAPSDFQKLFQPYFSTKGRGTGLGLAIVQRIVIEHGGKIKAVNNSPKGAKFIIELPVIA